MKKSYSRVVKNISELVRFDLHLHISIAPWHSNKRCPTSLDTIEDKKTVIQNTCQAALFNFRASKRAAVVSLYKFE